jgi:hypothetical protein
MRGRLGVARPVHDASKPIEQPFSDCTAFRWLPIEGVAPTRLTQDLRALKAGDFLVQELIMHGFSLSVLPT